MKGRFYAPFFYTEYTLDLTVKLARFLRRWQLGVACLDKIIHINIPYILHQLKIMD